MSTPKPAFPFVSPDPSRPLVIAHRGGSLEAPENTLAALERAIAIGADWQEVDVTLSSDGHAVILHDEDLDRTTDGRGKVETFTLAELRSLRAGAPRWTDEGRATLREAGVLAPPDFGNRYIDERLPLLEEVLRLPGMRMMLELKRVAQPLRLVEATLDAIARVGCRDRVAVASFEFGLLADIHARDPGLPLIGLCEDPEGRAAISRLPLTVLATWTKDVEQARASMASNLALWSWTNYHPSVADGPWLAGVDGVITDAPRALVDHTWPVRRPAHGQSEAPETGPAQAPPGSLVRPS